MATAEGEAATHGDEVPKESEEDLAAKRKEIREKVCLEMVADSSSGTSNRRSMGGRQEIGLDDFLSDRTLDRFIRANDGEVEGAVSQLAATWRWRCDRKPRWVCCPLCVRDPMSHSMRAVGVDAQDRLVFYSCFATSHNRSSAAANVSHMQRLLEDGQSLLDDKDIGPGKWVWFIDFHGFSTADVDPGTSSQCLALLKYYPERLGLAVIFDAGSMFETLWRTIRTLLNDVTASKVCFTSSLDEESLDPLVENLGSEVVDWLRLETAENRTEKAETKRYWEPPAPVFSGGEGDEPSAPAVFHDPRGLRSFVDGPDYGEFLPYGAGVEESVPVIDVKVDRLFDGKLGVRMKGLFVSGLDLDEAGEYWHVDDEVLEVNGNPVNDHVELGRAIVEARKELPIIFKIWRHDQDKSKAEEEVAPVTS